MTRLYQWLHARAMALRTRSQEPAGTRTTRTEVTVLEQRHMLLVQGGGLASGLECCPLCGQRLSPLRAQATETDTRGPARPNLAVVLAPTLVQPETPAAVISRRPPARANQPTPPDDPAANFDDCNQAPGGPAGGSGERFDHED